MDRWARFGLILCAVSAFMGLSATADASFLQFDVIPAYAPHGPISPSWNSYVANALTGIAAETDVGSRATDPAAYERIMAPIPPSEMIYTPFNSWRAIASPMAPFSGEFGNRVHFGLHVVAAPDMAFRLEDLTWTLDSDDVTDYFDQSGDFMGASYSATRVGINYGADSAAGGGDDIVYQGGEPGTNLIHELVYVGVGDGFISDNPSALTDQADIDLTLANIYAGCEDVCMVGLTATYSLPDPSMGGQVSSSGTVLINVPEPTSLTVVGTAAAAAMLSLLRKRKQGRNFRPGA